MNVLENNVTLSFENVEGLSEEKKIMHNLNEEVNGFKKVNRNSLKDWAMEVNAKNLNLDNITNTNRLIEACVILMGTRVGVKPNQRRGNSVNEAWWKSGIQYSIHIKILK